MSLTLAPLPADSSGAASRTAVVAILRRRILNGEYAPHQRLIEERLAQALGSPRSIVREALIELAGSGLVELRPHRGARVPGASIDEVAQTVFILRFLEAHLMGEASVRMSEAARLDLEASVARMRTAADAREARRALAALSGQSLTARVFAQLDDRLYAYRRQALPAAEHDRTAIREASALVAAVCAGEHARIVREVHAAYGALERELWLSGGAEPRRKGTRA